MKRNVLWMCLSACFLLAVSAVPAAAEGWQLRMVNWGENGWAAIKFNDTTGDCWYADEGNWVHCGEEGQVPEGKYELTLVAPGDDWYAIRLNTETGQSWEFGEDDWREMESQ